MSAIWSQTRLKTKLWSKRKGLSPDSSQYLSKLDYTVLTWEFPMLNMYLLILSPIHSLPLHCTE